MNNEVIKAMNKKENKIDDADDIKSYLNLGAKNAWDELENKCLEYQKMFKVIEGKE